MSAYAELVERARADEDVLGLILTGSRGRGFRVRPDSDWDVRLVLRDGAPDTYSTPHGSPVEVFVLGRSAFERTGLAGPLFSVMQVISRMLSDGQASSRS